MAQQDDEDDRDWDRNISGVLAELRPAEGDAPPPTPEPTPTAAPAPDAMAPDAPIPPELTERVEPSWKARRQWPVMALFVVLGGALVAVALWPFEALQGERPGSAASGSGDAAPLAVVEDLRAELREERARTQRLEARVDALMARLDGFEADRNADTTRLAGLALELEALRAPDPEVSAPTAQPEVTPDPPPSPADAEAPTTPVTAASSPGWTVSLVTLSEQASAEAYAREVRSQGWPADVRETGSRGGLWRVSSGVFSTRAGAEAHAAEVAAGLELTSVWVTQRSED